METYQSFADAEAASDENHTVSAAQLEDHSWVYFLTPADATNDEVREAAFEARHGKPMDSYQRFVMEQAKRLVLNG